jgi:glutaminase
MKREPDYQALLAEIAEEVRPELGRGEVADYIAPLARERSHAFAMAVVLRDGRIFRVGEAARRFSIQSISKLFTLTLAIRLAGEQLWDRVGREPSGNAFNSLVQLEHEQGIPRNPFINAGALVVADVILSHHDDGFATVRDFICELAGMTEIELDSEVARAELETGHRNQALAAFIKSFDNLENGVDEVLDLYVHHCALAMSCVELARAAMFLANDGISPWTGKLVVTRSQAKRINALMLTCGTYDAVGDFAYRVGLPGKSGVGGGIVGLIPGLLSVCVWSPGLNVNGNSLAGTLALELFTTKLGISIF